MITKKVGVFGKAGFVGRALCEALNKKGFEVHEFTRLNYEEAFTGDFDCVINAATPSARFKASQSPPWDFTETVFKTANIYYGVRHRKFIQISSLSAGCQLDTIYGRHKAAAECIVDKKNNLIIRLGPMYGYGLKKGVLVDMINQSIVYVAGESRYCFCSVEYVGKWIAENLHRTGIIEVGAKNSISLSGLAANLGIAVKFQGAVDHQELAAESGEDFPDVSSVVNFMKDWIAK